MFSKLVQEYLSDEEYRALQQALISNPEAGSVIRGSGGIRKLRWAGSGRGKRGGYRVIYYLANLRGTIWLLTMYPKNVQETIPVSMLKEIREEIEDGQD